MTLLHAVRAHVRRSPPRYSEAKHMELWDWYVGEVLVAALAEALAEFKPEDA